MTDTSALVAAAAETFHRKGYRNSTIDDIAEAAGISRPTVYNYTQSKQQLLDLMVDVVTGELSLRTKEVIDSPGTPSERLRRLISSYIAASTENGLYFETVRNEEVELSAAGQAAYQAWAADLVRSTRALLDECLATRPDEPARPVNTTAMANLVLSMLTALYRWYPDSTRIGADELQVQVETLLAVFLQPGSSTRCSAAGFSAHGVEPTSAAAEPRNERAGAGSAQ